MDPPDFGMALTMSGERTRGYGNMHAYEWACMCAKTNTRDTTIHNAYNKRLYACCISIFHSLDVRSHVLPTYTSTHTGL